ncbi:bifunctional DNA primase/polymerase [Thermus sp. FJN-A]
MGYVRLGYTVLPLSPGEKRPHGPEESLVTIRAWWTREPKAGVGILAPEGFRLPQGKRLYIVRTSVERLLAGEKEAPRVEARG